MHSMIFDYDGVLIRSEQAKALGWVVAALNIAGQIPERLTRGLEAGDQKVVIEAHDLVCNRWPQELEMVVALSGLSRAETCKAVWERLLHDYQGPLAQKDLDDRRKSIKDPLLLTYSEPIRGTVEFICAARGRLRLGLVTQTTREDVAKQAKKFKLPIKAFDVIECCGTPFFSDIPSDIPNAINKKAVAYAIACAKLGARPSEALAVEDSESGLEAATAAGLTVLGLCDQHNQQALSKAKLVVDDLSCFAQPEVIKLIAGAKREDIFDRLAKYTNQ